MGTRRLKSRRTQLRTIARGVAGAATVSVFLMIAAGVLSSLRRPRARHSGLGTAFSRPALLPAYLAVVASLVIGGLRLWRPLPLRLSSRAERAATLGGLALLLPGTALTFWGRVRLGRMWDLSSSLGATVYADHRLVTCGPFARVRHPIYLGWFLLAVGDVLVFRNWSAVFLLGSVPSMLLRSWREEQVLADQFGEAWTAYRRAVPAWIPRLRRTAFVARRGDKAQSLDARATPGTMTPWASAQAFVDAPEG